jgi:hypothetical protein
MPYIAHGTNRVDGKVAKVNVVNLDLGAIKAACTFINPFYQQ